ncbi:hypothetical protein C5C24_10245 [Rathayibacter sp. AY2B3]|uniref:hypothetical protein n=1 Tax=Rathayibacter sp. AY2B3 TaxID=2080569 RepID=UPI000CE86DFC|nr:hypothetical protein [Rathayibacter sp. AY2B3]PPG50345.1 hypothetical protein C5C24_10245 [Rathayibacter sp. AY2B3]
MLVVVDPVTQVEWVVPPFATVESTLRRAAQAREGELVRVVIGPDHTTPYALWMGNDAVHEPDAIGIPPAVAQDLREWQEFWSRGFWPEARWSSPSQEAIFEAEGERLQTAVEALLWNVAVVVRGF